jgi:hypothetical protein
MKNVRYMCSYSRLDHIQSGNLMHICYIKPHYLLIISCKISGIGTGVMQYHWGLGIGHIYSHEQYSDGSYSILANLIEPDDISEEQANDSD